MDMSRFFRVLRSRLFDLWRSNVGAILWLVAPIIVGGLLSVSWAELTKKQRWGWIALTGLGALNLVAWIILKIFYMTPAKEMSHEERDPYLRPDSDALLRVREAGRSCIVSQEAIELIVHPSLSTRTPFEQIGWTPEQITFRYEDILFDDAELFKEIGPVKDEGAKNGEKYSLVDHEQVGSDNMERFLIVLRKTFYYTITTAYDVITMSRDLRRRYGNLDPAHNRTPNTLCLQVVVRFLDGSYLVLFNAARKKFHPNKYSVSFEENMQTEDVFDGPPNLSNFFRRAIAEEVFGLTYGKTSERWGKVGHMVKHARIWTKFFEETSNNFSFLGVVQLSINPKELRGWWGDAARKGAVSDNEGKFFVAEQEQIQAFFTQNAMRLTNLFNEQELVAHSSKFHSTSRYRMFRVAQALRNASFLQAIRGNSWPHATDILRA